MPKKHCNYKKLQYSIIKFFASNKNISKKCDKLFKNEITGNLCMDLCVTKSLKIPQCSNDLSFYLNSTFKYYTLAEQESDLVCSTNIPEIRRIEEGISLEEFKETLFNRIKSKLDDSNKVDKIVNRILYTTDSNHDNKVFIYFKIC